MGSSTVVSQEPRGAGRSTNVPQEPSGASPSAQEQGWAQNGLALTRQSMGQGIRPPYASASDVAEVNYELLFFSYFSRISS